MANPSPSSPEADSCCIRADAAIESVKALHVVVASLMVDLAALRRAVLEHRQFADAYAKHLADASRSARPIVAEALACYDQMLTPWHTTH